MEGKTGPRATQLFTTKDEHPRSLAESSAALVNGFETTLTTEAQIEGAGAVGATVTTPPIDDQTNPPNQLRVNAEPVSRLEQPGYVGVLRTCVEDSLNRYFQDLNGQRPEGLYNLVVSEIEHPLLQTVMRECDNNQSRAAKVLGINRNTLRKKLKLHGFV